MERLMSLPLNIDFLVNNGLVELVNFQIKVNYFHIDLLETVIYKNFKKCLLFIKISLLN
jgi:hypothetical protein